MDPQLLVERLGQQLKVMRVQRGYTLTQLAQVAGLTRQKLAAIEKGGMTISMQMYAKVIAALGSEVKIVPARRPSFEELKEIFG